MLDLVKSVLSLWRLIDQGRKLWLDQSERRGCERHRRFSPFACSAGTG
jgi:hypothetical protein